MLTNTGIPHMHTQMSAFQACLNVDITFYSTEDVPWHQIFYMGGGGGGGGDQSDFVLKELLGYG